MESPKRTARLAGLAYLLLGIGSFFGFLCAPLVRPDAAAIAGLLRTSDLRFRVGVTSDLLCTVASVFLVIWLYELLERVDRIQAALMAVLLLVAAPMSFAISLADVAARLLFTGGQQLAAWTQPQLDALGMVLVQLHIRGVFAIEIFWGLWLIPFGLLVYRSRFVPRVFGVFLVAAGVAYTAHSLVSLLVPGPRSAAYEIVTMVGRGIGELPIILWLLIRGVRTEPAAARPLASRSVSPA
jgi:hypothetical protein